MTAMDSGPGDGLRDAPRDDAADGGVGDDDEEVGSDRAEEFAREHPGLVKFGRVGWAAKGVVYGLTGMLAMFIALRSVGASSSGGGEASQSGAIANIAQRSGGAFLLYVIAIGLLLYSAWRFVSIALPTDNDLEGWAGRAGYLVSAITYLVLAWTALSFARRPGSSQGSEGSEDARVEQLTRDLLDMTGGRALVIVAGVVLFGIGAFFLWRAYDASFESQISPGGVGPVSHSTLITLGRVGWVGRAVMMGLIGFFLVRAAVQFDADEAKGLDGSLRQAADSTIGTILVLILAIGLIAYGVFCVLSAPRRRLVAADE